MSFHKSSMPGRPGGVSCFSLSWNIAPRGAWFFDLLENVGIVTMLAMYPSQPGLLAWITMLFGLLKWALALLSIVLALVGLVKAAMNRFRKQTAWSGAGAESTHP